MQQYLDTCRTILEEGSWKDTRTGHRCLMVPGMSMRFDLAKGFPAVTTKELKWTAVAAELCGFLRGYTNAADFRALGCNVWNDNANGAGLPGSPNAWLTNGFREGEDDLGRIYGAQWREWHAYKHFKAGTVNDKVALQMARGNWNYLCSDIGFGNELETVVYHKQVDQISDCYRKIMDNPEDRRILFHAWNPAELDQMALPACHLLYQFVPNPATKELNLCLYIRSNDMFLGSPFNIASGALLLELMAHLTGYKPRWFTYFIGDAHIYENSIEAIKLQLTRTPKPLPKLEIVGIPAFAETGVEAPEWFDKCEPTHFQLKGYVHDLAIKGVKIAV